MLGISIGLNAISVHGTCTAVFVAVAAISGFLLASIRTLGRISWLAWVGLAFILCSGKPNILAETSRHGHLTYIQSSSSQSVSVFRIVPLRRLRQAPGNQTGSSSAIPPFPRELQPYRHSSSHARPHLHTSLSCARCGILATSLDPLSPPRSSPLLST